MNHKGRCLQWNITLGSALVQGTFGADNVRLFDVSGTQAIILLAFNNAQRLSYSEIKEATGLSDNELKRQLVSLSLSEHQILNVFAGESKGAESQSQAIGELSQPTLSKVKSVKRTMT